MRQRIFTGAVFLAAIAAVGLAVTGAIATRHPHPRPARLIDQLPDALEVPVPPPAQALLTLDRLPSAPADSAVGIPFAPEPSRGFVVRLRLTAQPGARPFAELLSLSHEQWKAYGSRPKRVDLPYPGTRMGPCDVASGGMGETKIHQRFDHLPKDAAGVLVVVSGAEGAKSQLEVLDAEMGNPRGSTNPILARLVRRFPNLTSTGASWRSALVARPGSRYVFEVTLPDQAVLELATGHEQGDQSAATRFVAMQDERVLLDEVVPGDHQWHDHALPLQGPSGARARISLIASPVEGAVGVPRGLWADPRIHGPPDLPNIVLITVDALRPDHLSAYGYPRDTSPSLKKLSDLSVRFDRATAQVPRTWESMLSLFTGRYPAHNGVRERGEVLSAEVPHFADVLSQYGYESFAGTDLAHFPAIYLSEFDEAESGISAGKISPLNQFRRIQPKLNQHPLFAWFHLEDTHYPLTPHQPARFDPDYQGRFQTAFTKSDHERFRRTGSVTLREQEHIAALYDASVRDADDEIRDLLVALNESGAWSRTVVVITADHGEQLGEHGVVLEHLGPYDSTLHVPLIFVWPEHFTPGVQVKARVQLIDVMPTLLSLAGLPLPEGLDGRDLSRALRGESLADAPAYAELIGKIFVQYRGDEKLIINPDHGVVRLKDGVESSIAVRELYDLSRDPNEDHNLSEVDRPRAEAAVVALKQELKRWEKFEVASGQIGPAALNALRQSGYIQDHPLLRNQRTAARSNASAGD